MTEEIGYGHIIRSLKKSRVRTEILMYLYKIQPQASYPSEISRHTNIDATNVLGGLKGMGARYDRNNSLTGLGVVELVNHNGVSYYRLSNKGKRVIDDLNSNKIYEKIF